MGTEDAKNVVRKVKTSRFGEIEVAEERIAHFKEGIPAFEDEHEFVILPYDEESPYYFMQSLKTPDLAFLLTVPFLFFPNYSVEIDDEILKELGVKDQKDVLLYALVTIPNYSIHYMTANLLAPILLNLENMQARQVVLDRSNYTTKHRLFPDRDKGAK